MGCGSSSSDTLQLPSADCVNGIDAIPEKGYLVYYGGHFVQLDYPKQDGSTENRTGVSFHHGRFIMKLREAAKSHSNVQCVEGMLQGKRCYLMFVGCIYMLLSCFCSNLADSS